MRVEMLEDALLAGLNLKVPQLMTADGDLAVDAAGCGLRGRCPQCEHPAARLHSRYWRQLSEVLTLFMAASHPPSPDPDLSSTAIA